MNAPANLSPEHASLLRASAISEEVADERGYRTVTRPKDLERWFGPTQRRLVPALLVPVIDVDGAVAFAQIRPDEPRVVKGKRLKYETPYGARMKIDVPPRVRPVLGDPSIPLIVTEGSRKADSAVCAGLYAIALIGVWNWRGTNDAGGKTVLADFEAIALNGRKVYLAFDSDVMEKREVRQALERLAGFLGRRGATVLFILLPSGDGGAKTGLDDYIAAGHDRDDVLARAADELPPFPADTREANREPPADVDGAVLLTDLREFIDRHMVLPANVADLLAVWTLHTWAFRAAWATGYLRITSAAPESGKSQLMEILASIARSGWYAVNPSPAVLYRKIERDAPTLLLDEIDNFPIDDKRDALAVLNAGYKRGAKVPRCNDKGDLEEFNCFCPKAYAGIDAKQLPPALISRSITIRLERKMASEEVAMWIAPLAEPEALELRKRCDGWAHHHADRLATAHPVMPDGFVNRTVEAWWALLAIADEVGGNWPGIARAAARALTSGGDARDDQAVQVRLLADIKAAFGSAATASTKDLLETLNADDEAPWGARRRGDGLDARGLSRMLRPYKTPEGAPIRPKNVRDGAHVVKGYGAEQFADAWSRYLPPTPDPSATSATSATSPPHSQADVADVADVAATEAAPANGNSNGHGPVERLEPTCAVPAHRGSDWALPNPGAGWVCGVCHPPSAAIAGTVDYRRNGKP